MVISEYFKICKNLWISIKYNGKAPPNLVLSSLFDKKECNEAKGSFASSSNMGGDNI